MSDTSAVARGYTRVSTDEQRRSGIGLEVQEDQIKRFFDYKLGPTGFRWGGIFRDEAVSGYKLPFLRRPAGSALHAELRAGDCIIFAKLDRGFRNVRDCEKMIQLWDSMNVGVYFLDLDVDTRSLVGRFLLRLIAAVAEWEYEKIRERNREVAAWRKSHNMPMGKPKPRIGYRYVGAPGKKKLVPAGNDRDVIDRIIEWHIAGSRFEDIACHLQRLNTKTFDGREWTLRRVQKAFYRELAHLVKDGSVVRVGKGFRGRLILKWASDKLPVERIGRITEMYLSLGRTINDTAQEAVTELCCTATSAEPTPDQNTSASVTTVGGINAL